jgi:hypothetical protein
MGGDESTGCVGALTVDDETVDTQFHYVAP